MVVQVTGGLAGHLNFSLEKEDFTKFVQEYDFGLTENMEDPQYLGVAKVTEELEKLKGDNPGIMDMETFRSESGAVVAVHLSANWSMHEGDEPHVALIGSLYEDQPIGNEMLLRLTRHLVRGMYMYVLFSVFLDCFCPLSTHIRPISHKSDAFHQEEEYLSVFSNK